VTAVSTPVSSAICAAGLTSDCAAAVAVVEDELSELPQAAAPNASTETVPSVARVLNGI
jgi:hypothetical protein